MENNKNAVLRKQRFENHNDELYLQDRPQGAGRTNNCASTQTTAHEGQEEL
jgi:hypothetical protein